VTQHVFGNTSRRKLVDRCLLQKSLTLIQRIPWDTVQNIQFQGLGKFTTVFVFVTHNVSGHNSRRKLAHWAFSQTSMTLIQCVYWDSFLKHTISGLRSICSIFCFRVPECVWNNSRRKFAYWTFQQASMTLIQCMYWYSFPKHTIPRLRNICNNICFRDPTCVWKQ